MTTLKLPIYSLRPLLYSFRRCPYAMRARMAMLQAACPFDVFEVSLRNKPDALLALSPKGTVPVLQLPDGRVLDESWEIMAWALGSADQDGCWSRARSMENLALLECNDGVFKHHLDRYKYSDRYPGALHSADAHRRQAVEALLVPLEARLQYQPYLGDAVPCATDLAIFPFVRQFAAVDPEWFSQQELPALRAWLHGWLSSPLFDICMTRLRAGSVVAFPALQK